MTAFLRKELTRRLAALDTHIARLDAEIERSIGAEPEMRRRLDILISIPSMAACLQEQAPSSQRPAIRIAAVTAPMPGM
ncbi:hypothetical protein ACDA55_37225, partial [Rhizobium ruizarguesonis]